MRVGVGAVERLGHQLAHLGPRHGCADQLAGLILDPGKRHQQRPAAHVADAQQHQRLAHRADLARQQEVGGVDPAQQPVAEAEVAADRSLEVVQLAVGVLQHRHHPHLGEAVGGDAVAGDRPRPAEEVALEVVEADLLAELEGGVILDPGGDQLDVVRLQLRHLRGQLVSAEGPARPASRSRLPPAAAGCRRASRSRRARSCSRARPAAPARPAPVDRPRLRGAARAPRDRPGAASRGRAGRSRG